MSVLPRFFRMRVRDASNTSDAIVITSVRGGTNPHLSSVPSGDGQEFDPITGKSRCGAYTGLIADAITAGTDRVMTSQLEDASFRQQLMARRAFLEWSSDGATWSGGTNGGVLIAGFLTALRLANGAEYEYTVSDPTRAEQDFTAFSVRTSTVVLSAAAGAGATTISIDPLPMDIADGTGLADFGTRVTADASAGATSLSVAALPVALTVGRSATYSEPLSSFLARWPNRGCILGGPVRGGFLSQPDRGGWEMTVEKSGTGTFLRFNAGYGPPKFARTTNPQDVSHSANDRTDPLAKNAYGSVSKIVSVGEANAGAWPGLVCELIGVGFFQPDPGVFYNPGNVDKRMDGDGEKHLIKDIRDRGMYLAGTATPAAGTKVRVRVFTFEASELSPIYWTGHPADLLAKLWTEAGLAYSASSITTVKNAIGTTRTVSFRITKPANLGEWLERNIYGPFGIGVRPNDSGDLEAFAARIPYAVAPTTEITKADVWSDESGAQPEVFAIDQASAIRKLSFTHQRLVRTQEAFDDSTPDGFVVQQERFERTNIDPGAIGSKVIDYSVDGMVHSLDSNNPNTAMLVDALALELFDRAGRGMITGELQGLRGGSTDSVKLGDEILNKHPYLPNHNKRLADDPSVSSRAMQIVRYTWDPRGPSLKLIDSGPNAQPYATVPTLSIAASSTFPRTGAEVTVTNAATLNTDSAGLRLRMAVTTGAAPAPDDYTDVAAYAAGAIPTGAIVLPAVVAGRTVWVRAYATKVGKRISSPSTAVSVTLATLPAPSGISVTPSGTDGSLAPMTWTAGDTVSLVDIYLRKSTDPASANILQRTLPAGSIRYTLEGLTPSQSYTVTVQDRDVLTGDVSTAATATFTAGATTATLPAPVSPFGFAGSRDPVTGAPQRDGVFGIVVVASAYPGFIEVAIATETAFGSGVYGAFVTDGRRIPSVLGDWTEWSDIAPNDGLRRQLKARQVGDGLTSSAYTAVVTVQPWTPQILPVSALVVQPTPGPTSYSIAWSGTGTITLSIDGGAYSTPAASPIVVARDGSDHTYAFKSVGLQTVTDVVVVPSLEKDTVTPDLTVTPGTPTATTQPYSVVAANPAGGAAPTLSVTCTGCTMTVGATTYPDGTTLGITTGTTVTANRPSSTTTTQAKLKFDAAISGGGLESIVVDVTPQLNLGPSLQVNATPGSTSYSIAWTGTGTITLSIDGASFGTPSASPIAVTRDSSDHTYTFKAIADGQEIRQTVAVPALPATAGALPVIDTFFTPSNGLTSTSYAQNTTTDRIDLRWTAINIPAGATFDLVWALGGGATTRIVGVTSPYAHAKTGTGGHGLDLVNGGTFEDMRYTLLMLDSSGHEVASRGLDAIVDHA